MNIIDWVIEHYEDIIFAITSIVTGVSLVVKITPTLKDDSIWLPVVKFLAKYFAINDSRPHEELRNLEK